MKKYFTHNGAEQIGPFDIDELKNQKINRESMVWAEGMTSWSKAEDIEELRSIFVAIPPPINKPIPPPLVKTDESKLPQQSNLTSKIKRLIVPSIVAFFGFIIAFFFFLQGASEYAKTIFLLTIVTVVLCFIWRSIGGLKVYSIISLVLSLAGIIAGLGIAFYATQELSGSEIGGKLSQIFVLIGAGIALYSIYFLAYSITVLASVRKK